jgi:prepilin-type N-terminal cleavage/methylation domain-containing protein
MKLRIGNRGDTIVEVMIVLAVLGLAISISYTTANKSLQAVRAAQESAKAHQLLQSQTELLRALSVTGNTNPAKDVFIPGPFCIDVRDPTHVPPTVKLTTDTKNAADPCYYEELYSISVTYVNTVTNPSTFTLKATWPDVNGKDTDGASLTYRFYKP